MYFREWDDLPDFMKCEEVRPYYIILSRKKTELILKRVIDLCIAYILLVLLAIPMLLIAIMVNIDSSGSIIFCQERITSYGKRFTIYKFRTMHDSVSKNDSLLTVNNDKRITKLGCLLRKYHLDEIPQLINVIKGDMSFVGTRPELEKYVRLYKKEMYATLLLPAGITSEASILFKDESALFDNDGDIEKQYVENILPTKMFYNLEAIKSFSLIKEAIIMFRTMFAICRKN